jgi:thioredoxin
MRQIATKDEFDALLAQNSASSATTFVDFTATWCGPCQRIGPIFEALAKEFPQATFVKVDVEKNQETAAAYAVRAMPTFQTFVKKNKVDDLTGADEAGLRAMVMKHAGSKFVGAGHTLGGGSATATTAGMTDREKRLAALERRGLGGGSGSSDAPPLDHSSKPQAVAAAASAIAPAASASAPPAPPPAPVPMPASAQPVSAPAPAAPPPPDAPPMAPPPVLPAVSPAAGAIAQLQAMGFADVEAIKLALEASNGDVEQALALLVE